MGVFGQKGGVMESKQKEKMQILIDLHQQDKWDMRLVQQQLFRQEFNMLKRTQKRIVRKLCEGVSHSVLAKHLEISFTTLSRYKRDIKYVFRTGTQRRIDDWVKQLKRRAKWKSQQKKETRTSI